jgi:methylase of polypeptide subunit release factors
LCDFPTVTTSFARVGRNLLSRRHLRATSQGVAVVQRWGINFEGGGCEASPCQLYPGEPPAYFASSGVRAPKDSLWRVIVRHFRALDRRPPSHVPYFNGNLFKPHLSEELIVSDEWLAGFVADLSDDESPYLFNYIAVEILGTIYERFLGKTVRPHGRGVTIEEKPEVRKAGGVYYTPRYIVEYIVKQTVEKLLHDAKPDATLKLHFLDPACGSGSFLLRVFEAVCEHWQQWLTDHPGERKKKWCWVDAATGDVHLTMSLKRQILTSNVFGVDLDPGAVEVTQLSLYLKMLENENRNTLQRQRELLPDDDDPLLPPLENNIKCFNSLIGSDFSMMAEDLVRVNAQDWDINFPAIIKSGGLDAVVGNPPYIPIETMADDERGYYSTAYPQLERKFDTGVIFILRALKLIKRTGLVGYISSITWETGENFSSLREQMFTKYGVREVINLPFNTFADAYVDTGVYILCGQPTPEYRIYRYSKKAKIDSLKDASPVTVATSLVTAPAFRLVLNPQAQKILIRALSNSGFKQFGEFTKSTQGLAADRFQRGGSAKSSEWYAFGEQAQAYRYDFVVEEKSFAYMRDNPSLKQFYEAEPKILIRRIINRQDRLDACYCDEQMVFKKDINPFVLTVPKLSSKFILGILNSRLLSYLYVNTSAIATKDDFRQTTLAELRGLPIPFPNLENKTDKSRHDKLVLLVDKLLGLMPKQRAATSEREKATLQNAVTATDQQIDALVYELYGLTEKEIKLVEGGQ